MNKYIIPLLTFCAFIVARENADATEDVIKNDTSMGTPPTNQVPETAKEELIRLLSRPINLEIDQEPTKLRIKQLQEQLSKGSSESPPRTPPRYISNQHVIEIGNLGKGHHGVNTETLINLGLRDKRIHNGELSKLTPSEIERAATAVMELVDPNMPIDETQIE